MYPNQPVQTVRRYIGYAPLPVDPKAVPGTLPRVLAKDVQWQDEYGASGWVRDTDTTVEDAEVVTSWLVGSKLHGPVLDIDIPHALVPSTTPGHAHLYLDVKMSWRKYKRVLRALAAAGIIEKGYVKASLRRKHTAVRVPWLAKPLAEEF